MLDRAHHHGERQTRQSGTENTISKAIGGSSECVIRYFPRAEFARLGDSSVGGWREDYDLS
jgi:hypothetical protein